MQISRRGGEPSVLFKKKKKRGGQRFIRDGAKFDFNFRFKLNN